jgi:hypothetical protein
MRIGFLNDIERKSSTFVQGFLKQGILSEDRRPGKLRNLNGLRLSRGLADAIGQE